MKYTKFVNLTVRYKSVCWTHKEIMELLQKSGLETEITTEGDILPDDCTCCPTRG